MCKYLALAVALAVAACGSDDHSRECSSNADCDQGGIPGTCRPSPESAKQWCSYPDTTCPAPPAERWGALAGDGLAQMCVDQEMFDGGLADAGIDGGPIDAAPDGSVDATPASDAALDPMLKVSAGGTHTCIVLTTGSVKCWGSAMSGQIGYGSTFNIGDDEFPSTAGNVDVGTGVVDITTGDSHTCALLTMGRVRCWGAGNAGRLGYGNTNNIGDTEAPISAGNVDVGAEAMQIAAGLNHTCVLLTSGNVRCWGGATWGQLGYGNTNSIGDNESPSSAGIVNVGGTAMQIVAGSDHTCVLLTTGNVRCWGRNLEGQLGYGNTNTIGDDEVPSTAGDVSVGGTVMQLAAGNNHTCALLTTGAVRCWGAGTYGRLGYGNTNTIGDNELPSSAGDVNVGGAIMQIAAGGSSTCALLSGGAVRCWGGGALGKLGYGNTSDIGDNEAPLLAGDVGVGGAVQTITVGGGHMCVLLTTGNLKCWGGGQLGRLGYGNTNNIGDNESPSTVGSVPF